MEKLVAVVILIASAVWITLTALIAYPPEFLCESEDSTNCLWLAPVQGNGIGHSFIDVGGTAYYLN